jgi:hypothetical protein
MGTHFIFFGWDNFGVLESFYYTCPLIQTSGENMDIEGGNWHVGPNRCGCPDVKVE